jgi:hypothetical protein
LFDHHGDQFACDEGEGHEHRGKHDAGQCEDDGIAACDEPAADEAVGAEHQHDAKPRHDGRNRERQVDQRDEKGFAAKVELGDEPSGGDAEQRVQRHGDGRDQQRQLDGRCRIAVAEACHSGGGTIGQRLDKDGKKRGRDQHAHTDDRKGDQGVAGQRSLVPRRAELMGSGVRHIRSSGGSRPRSG